MVSASFRPSVRSPGSKLQAPPGFSLCARLCQHQQQHQPHRCIPSRASSRPDDFPFDERTRRGLREAAEVLSEAQELAQQQTLAELMGSWQADQTSSSSSSSNDAAAAVQPSPPAALQAFLTEQGLSQSQAEKFLKTLTSDSQYAACLNTQLLGQKLASLGRVLPDTELAQLVLAEPELLLASSNQLVTNLVCLISGLPGRDVMGMVLRRPRLLLVDDMPARLERIVNKLVALHPSHSHTVIAGIVEENPELLFRMDYYLGDDIRLIDQLPIEIANMMVLGDESGIGFLYKYWNNKLGRPSNEQEWPEGGSGSSSSAA